MIRSSGRFLSLADLPGSDLQRVTDLALEIKMRGRYQQRHGEGRRVGLVFLNPSLRTRASMELAAQAEGAHVTCVTPGQEAWKLDLRPGAVMDGDAAEHLLDAVRVLSEMVDVLAVRCFAGLADLEEDRREPVLSLFARESRVPVVNMESALDHPLQALADLVTMQEEFGRDLRGVPVTLTWAPHPRALPLAVPAAFLRGCARAGMRIRVAAPPGFELPQFLLDEARALAPSDARVEVFDDQREAVRDTRVVYAKAWAAPSLYGDPEAGAAARRAHAGWTVTEPLMALGHDAIFMHCLPVRRNVVVADEVLDGPRNRAYREAGNRYHTARAVLATLLGGLA